MLALKAEVEKQRKTFPMARALRQAKPEYLQKVCALWQKKDILTRIVRDPSTSNEPTPVRATHFTPEVIEVSALSEIDLYGS